MENIRVNTNIKPDILYKLIEIKELNQDIINQILSIKDNIDIIEYNDIVFNNFNYISRLIGILNINHIIKIDINKEYNLETLKLLFINNPKIKLKYDNKLITIDQYIERKINND